MACWALVCKSMPAHDSVTSSAVELAPRAGCGLVSVRPCPAMLDHEGSIIWPKPPCDQEPDQEPVRGQTAALPTHERQACHRMAVSGCKCVTLGC